MSEIAAEPHRDEWRVEVELGEDEHGHSIGERLRSLNLDQEARERLGERVIVTRDGPHLFLYARDERAAREAERVVRELLAGEELTGRISLTRWHPDEEAWEDASVPLPQTEAERAAERARHEAEEIRAARESGETDFEVGVGLHGWRETLELARELARDGFHVHRRWKYLLVGAPTEQRAHELAREIEARAPEGATVEVRVSPHDLPNPTFVLLSSLKRRLLG